MRIFLDTINPTGAHAYVGTDHTVFIGFRGVGIPGGTFITATVEEAEALHDSLGKAIAQVRKAQETPNCAGLEHAA